jgi:YD repeat-containing protein
MEKVTFDNEGRKIKHEYSKREFVTYEYDVNGNPYKETDQNGNVTMLGFSKCGREIVKIDSDGMMIFMHNSDGKLDDAIMPNTIKRICHSDYGIVIATES